MMMMMMMMITAHHHKKRPFSAIRSKDMLRDTKSLMFDG